MKKYFVTGIYLLIGSCVLFAQNQSNHHFEISKNLDIFNSMYKELDLFYVDTLNTEKVIHSGIIGMLKDLDPYTDYISDSESGELKLITTGEYAGIGSLIMLDKNKRVIISEPYEDMPAQKNGLKAGDIILEIDGESMNGKSVTEVSSKLKGQANTIVKVKVERFGEKKPIVKDIKRENILINSVPYFGMIDDRTGYISLSGFTDKTGSETKHAVLDLINNHKAEKLILDLRNNPGGVMDAAVQVVNLFVPKGSAVVSTKGKIKQWNRTYKTISNPVAEDIPLVVLVNNGSASASEIVSGALQDLDRAVIVGARTFGKGLVQTTRDLPYNGTLKVTIAKYYIPSGRCIQAIDYTHRDESGSADYIPDSLTTEFSTANGRKVRDGRGVTPDFTVESEKPGNIAYYLFAENVIFDYATQYAVKHPTIGPVENFSLTDADYEDFKQYVKSNDFTYDRQTARYLKSLKEIAEFEGYLSSASSEFAALESKLTPDLNKDLETFKSQIKKLLSAEIVKRYYYQKGEIIESLKNDVDLKKAVEVLNDSELYRKTLSGEINEKGIKRTQMTRITRIFTDNIYFETRDA